MRLGRDIGSGRIPVRRYFETRLGWALASAVMVSSAAVLAAPKPDDGNVVVQQPTIVITPPAVESPEDALARVAAETRPAPTYYHRLMRQGDSGSPLVPIPSGDSKENGELHSPEPRTPAGENEDGLPTPRGPVGLTFVANGNTLGGEPPDPACAVGPDAAIAVVNTNMGIYDKQGNRIFTSELDTFFNSLRSGNVSFDFIFDPRAIYDHYLQRFIVLILANDNGDSGVENSYLLLAVSKTSNPNGDVTPGSGQAQWLKYAIATSTTDSWSDYPTLGIDEDTIYLTYNMFPKMGAGGVFTRMHLIDKSPLQDPINPPPMLNSRFFGNGAGDAQRTASGGLAFTIQPAISFGTTETEWHVSIDNGFTSANQVFLYARDGGGSPNQIRTFAINVPTFRPAGAGRQRGTGAPLLESVSDRFNNACVWRDNSLWAAHSIQGANGSAVRWYQFSTANFPSTPLLVQTGDITAGPGGIGGSHDNFMPGIMVNPSGDMFVEYTCSGPADFASLCYAHRLKDDPLNTTQAPTLLVPGIATYRGFGGGIERWGDYSGVALDPADDSTLWAFHELSTAGGDWTTWFGNATLTLTGGGGGPPVPPKPTSIIVNRPNAFTNFVTNTIERINWSAPGPAAAPLKISLYRGSTYLGDIANGVQASVGLFDWTVGSLSNNVATPGADTYRIRVAAVNDPAIFDDSDNFFRITEKVQVTAGVFDDAGLLQPSFEFAPEQSIRLNAVAAKGLPPYFYKWTPQDFLDNPNVANPVARPLRGIVYTVTVRDATGTSNATDVELISGDPLRIDAGATALFPSSSGIVLEGSVAGGSPPYKIEWFDCDPNTCKSQAFAFNLQPLVFPTGPTVFFLRITDSAGAVRMDNVLVEPGYTIQFENDPGNGGTVSRAPVKSLYRFTDVVALTATPAAGFVFDHWDADASGKTNPVSISFPSRNAKVRAVYVLAPTTDETGQPATQPAPGNCGFGLPGGFLASSLLLLFVRLRRPTRRRPD